MCHNNVNFTKNCISSISKKITCQFTQKYVTKKGGGGIVHPQALQIEFTKPHKIHKCT